MPIGVYVRPIRPLRPLVGGVVEVPLTRGYVALIDEADAGRVGAHNWCVMLNPRTPTPYAIRNAGGRGTVYLHRFILDAPSDVEVDHASGDGLDNRRANLRQCTAEQNGCNRRKFIVGRSRFKGVTWHPSGWRARIRLSGRLTHLGFFDSEREAALVYDVAARDFHGPFASPNFQTVPHERGLLAARPISSR